MHIKELCNLSRSGWTQLNGAEFVVDNMDALRAIMVTSLGLHDKNRYLVDGQYIDDDELSSMLFIDASPIIEYYVDRFPDVEPAARDSNLLAYLKTFFSRTYRRTFFATHSSTGSISSSSFSDDELPSQSTTLSDAPHAYCVGLSDSRLSADERLSQAEDERDCQVRASSLLESVRHILSPREYDVLRYIACEGLSARNIADLTGRTPSNVYEAHLRAQQRIAEHFAEHGNDLLHELGIPVPDSTVLVRRKRGKRINSAA